MAILAGALVLFFTGWIRMDIVALLVMGALAFSGLITPQEALSGFSNQAVVTVWAMFIISAALYQTGVARIIGKQMIRIAGTGEIRLIIMIMLATGVMSAFMNNIGVAALMLPVVMDIARAKGVSPSRLLMPLAFGSLLGGLTTLIGTPPNLLISYALDDAGLRPFGLFDYSPVGFGALFAGILFMVLVGRHFLPKRDALSETGKQEEKRLSSSYALQERTFLLHVKPSSRLAGKTLAESRLRAGLGLNLLSIIRGGTTLLDPGADTTIQSNDKLHVQGRKEAIQAMQHWKVLLPDQTGLDNRKLLQQKLHIFEARLAEKSTLEGKRLQDTDFRKRLGINVLAVKRAGTIERNMLHDLILQQDDAILMQGPEERMELLRKEGIIDHIRPLDTDELISAYQLHEVLFIMEVTDDAALFERAVSESQIGSAFGLTVLGTFGQQDELQPYIPGTGIREGDRLLVKGNIDDLPLLQGLKELNVLDEEVPEVQSLESDEVQMAEVVLAPRSLLAGKTLREINFRQKYGLTVLAIWREGRAYRTNLHNMPLRFGEALLLYGKKEKLEIIGSEPDFIMLTEMASRPLRTGKALTSALVMAAILIPVLLGLVPLAIAAVIGIALMVLTGCLRMEEAYRAIEWRAVFLIAGMLPLGIAMQETGAAAMLAEGVVNVFGRFGPWGVIGGLYLLTAISTIAIHPAALVVIMSPIALEAAESFSISPHTLMMAIAIAAAACFMSPLSHPANLLVMGPGGYRFVDYIKVGLPLTLVVMLVSMLLLPIFWPL
ncbi:MAG: SLC13 family permease [Bacteroidales bacterium]|nr:SLC13 family permease [Bacteroidales bacterium]